MIIFSLTNIFLFFLLPQLSEMYFRNPCNVCVQGPLSEFREFLSLARSLSLSLQVDRPRPLSCSTQEMVFFTYDDRDATGGGRGRGRRGGYRGATGGRGWDQVHRPSVRPNGASLARSPSNSLSGRSLRPTTKAECRNLYERVREKRRREERRVSERPCFVTCTATKLHNRMSNFYLPPRCLHALDVE